MSSCSAKQSRGSTFHRSALSLSPRKKFKMHSFPDLTDFWNRNKTNSISQQNSRDGCDDSTISTKTSAFTKHMIFDLLSEHKRNAKWNQAHILSSLPPHINEKKSNQTIDRAREIELNSNSEQGTNDKVVRGTAYGELIHGGQFSPSKSATISIILMDVQNHQYEILQLRLNWCKSSVGDILKIIDKAIDENITACFLPESKFEHEGGFDDSNCASIDSMADCRFAKESITADMGTQKSNNITTLDGHDSFSESLISKIELTSDQFQRLDAYHRCQGNSNPDHANSMKSSSKLKEIWEVRYDGILQCRSLPDEKPIVMINCFGLMRYEVAPHEVFLAKPKGMSARETTSHADIMFKQLEEKGMIRRNFPDVVNDASCSTKPKEILITMSYLARSRIVGLNNGDTKENSTTNTTTADFLTFSPPFDSSEPILPPRCPRKRRGRDSLKVHPFPHDSFQYDGTNCKEDVCHSVQCISYPSSPKVSNSPPISEPPSPTLSPVKGIGSVSREVSFEFDDYDSMIDTTEFPHQEPHVGTLITVGEYQVEKYTPEIQEGDTPLLSKTSRKSLPVTKPIALGSFDAAIRTLEYTDEIVLSSSSDDNYPQRENEQNANNSIGHWSRRNRRLAAIKVFPSKNTLSHIAKKVKDRRNINKKSIDKTEKNNWFSLGYSKVEG